MAESRIMEQLIADIRALIEIWEARDQQKDVLATITKQANARAENLKASFAVAEAELKAKQEGLQTKRKNKTA